MVREKSKFSYAQRILTIPPAKGENKAHLLSFYLFLHLVNKRPETKGRRGGAFEGINQIKSVKCEGIEFKLEDGRTKWLNRLQMIRFQCPRHIKNPAFWPEFVQLYSSNF